MIRDVHGSVNTIANGLDVIGVELMIDAQPVGYFIKCKSEATSGFFKRYLDTLFLIRDNYTCTEFH